MATIRRNKTSLLRSTLAASAALSMMLAGMAPAAAEVGVAAAVNTDARGKAPGARPRVISIGERLVYNEEVNTDGTGLVQILLLDGTTFTVGPNSRLVIDEFVYNPSSGEARVVASVTKGAFRFIGGQTSRKAGGATIRTPVGTIGIRGAMVEGNVQAAGSTLISMVFGDEVAYGGGKCGKPARIFRPSFTLVVRCGAGGGSQVRARTKSDAQAFLDALAGKSGSNGGASERPTDSSVADSGVSQVLSDLPDSMFLPPVRPSPVQSTPIDDIDDTLADINVIAGEILTSAIVGGAAQPLAAAPTPQPGPGPEPPPPEPPQPPEPPPVTTLTGRVLTAPATYVDFSGESYPAAGSRGLVGSTTETDRQIVFSQENGRLISALAGMNLPDLTGTDGDGGLEQINVTNATGPNGPLSGPAYAGVGDFVAYFLGENGNAEQPNYTIVGTGTDIAQLIAGDDGEGVREYSLTVDPIRDTPVPFFAPDIYGDLGNTNATNFLVVEPNESSAAEVRTFITWIDITGEGTSQKSATALYTAPSVSTGQGVAIGGARRGSFRPGATDGIYNMRGDISTIAGPDGSHFFGPNANHFILGASIDPADTYVDLSDNGAFTNNPNDGYLGDGVFSTHHVSDLTSDTPQSALPENSRNVRGFMTGMVESSARAPGVPYIVASVTPTFTLGLDATEHTVSAQGTVFDVAQQDTTVGSLSLTFDPGASTFVDDNRYGAVQDADHKNIVMRTDGGRQIAHDSELNPGSYLVSGRAAPLDNYQHCPSCDFIDWGWWGTRASFNTGSTGETSGLRHEYAHLGTWVGGDITNEADLPTTLVVSYNGTALGNISRRTDSGIANYIASGGFGMTYDFNARQGSIDITNFDGFNLSGNVSGNFLGDPSQFFSVFEGDLTGGVVGAFVNDGTDHAAGVIGNFGFVTETVRAVGTLAGARTNTAAAGLAAPQSLGLAASGEQDALWASALGLASSPGSESDGAKTLIAGANPASRMISGRANPIPGFEHCKSCDFLDWGWWGTGSSVGPNGENPNAGAAFAKGGTWVAGNITNPADLPNNISASYAGTALGSVTRGASSQMAAGTMNMTYDFAKRSGTMQISDFGGLSAGGLISEVANPTQALFGGGLAGQGVTGNVDGAFVNNGSNVAAGVIGQFGLSGAGVSASGTIAGARVP